MTERRALAKGSSLRASRVLAAATCVALSVGCGAPERELVGGDFYLDLDYGGAPARGDPDEVIVGGGALGGRLGPVDDAGDSSADTRLVIHWASRQLLEVTLEREGPGWGAMTQLGLWADVLGDDFAPGTSRALIAYADEGGVSGLGCSGPVINDYYWDDVVAGADVTVTESFDPPGRVLHFAVRFAEQAEPAHASLLVR
jgi:hypothetical protein